MTGQPTLRVSLWMLVLAMLCCSAPAAAQGLSWEQLGPSGAFGYEPIGADSTGALYAARYRYSGIFRSLDQGESWALVAPHAMTSFTATRSAIVIVDGGGRILRSVDRGVTWSHLLAVSAKGDTAMLGVAASPDGALYAMTRVFFPNPAEILRSTDDGASWATLFAPGEQGVRIIGFAPDGTVFVNADRVAYRSTDRGDLWTPIPGFQSAIGDVRFDATGRLATVAGRALYFSTDNGASWIEGDSVPAGSYTHFALAADGAIVLAGSPGAYLASDDDGATWISPQMPPTLLQPTALIAVGDMFLTSGLNGTGGPGILRSTDGGRTFIPVGRGLPGPVIQSVHALGDSVVLATTSGYQRFRLERRAGAWQAVGNGNVMIETAGDGSLYSVTSGGFSRSTNAGLTWESSDTTEKLYLTMASPGPTGEVAAATASGAVMLTRDFGRSWSRLDSEFVEQVSSIAFDSSGAVLVGTPQSGLYRYDASADRFRGLDARVSASTVTDIMVAPDGDIFVATSGQGIRRSTDGGTTFVDASVGLRSLNVSALAFSSRGDLLAATDSSLFLSRTNGDVWGFEGADLPEGMSSISLDPSDRVVVGTTLGVFMSRESAASSPLVSQSDASIGLHCVPNPSSGRVTIEVNGGGRHVLVRIVDALGQRLATLHDGALAGGTIALSWYALSTPAGAYRVVVESDGVVHSAPLVIVH
jgi:photosystem II stability/assembly factor-like uncharacterized protein